MIYILHGADSFSRTRDLERIRSSLGGGEMLSMNTTTLDGRDIGYEKISEVCCTAPFLSPIRLVIIDGLIGRFETSGDKGAEKKRGQKTDNKSSEVGLVSGILKGIPDSTTVIFVDDELKPHNSLLKALEEMADVRSYPLLKESSLTVWITGNVKNKGARISPGAVKLLIDLAGNDLWTLSHEIEKLLSYSEDKTINEEDVKQITSFSRDISIFNLIDAIMGYRPSLAQKYFRQLIKQGVNSSYIMSMILRQLRLIIKAKCFDKGINRTQSKTALGLRSDYALDKVMRQARAYSIEQIKTIFERILETDTDIKTGKYDNELAMDLLIVELCKR
jgi:DNA polymerase-3 subunit delta